MFLAVGRGLHRLTINCFASDHCGSPSKKGAPEMHTMGRVLLIHVSN